MSAKPARARIWIYVAVCALLAGGAAFFAVHRSTHFSLSSALGFGALAFIAAQFPLSLSTGSLYDISFVITIAALVAAGPGEATIATAFATISIREAFRRPPIRHVFNVSQLTLCAALGGLVYVSAGGLTGPAVIHQAYGSPLLRYVFVPLTAATVTTFLINTSLVSGAIALNENQKAIDVWRSGYRDLIGTYSAFALLGLMIGILKTLVDWSSILFVLMPLLVARHAFQAAFTMHGAYDETVNGLIKAIDAKDPYTKGHAQRVSQLTEITARAYGLSEERCRAIRYAALMHDIGKLGVLSTVLQKPGKLTPDEYEHMKVHPVRGVEIVGEIDLLQEAIDGVRHHHERLDGKGYPDGLVGDQIPLFARLIMVADAFDSMTSTRTYRTAKTIEEAFAELRRCAGTQFDARALAALELAIERNGWEPHPEAREHVGPMKEMDGGAQAVSL